MTKIETLMVIDDDHVDQMLYARIAKRSGVVNQIIPFFLAQDALDYLISGAHPQPDLILLDINMPKMDGFEFLAEAVTHLGEDFCPIVFMLTTSIDPRDKARAEALKVVKDFLNKPLTEEMLQNLAASTIPTPKPLSTGGLHAQSNVGSSGKEA